MLTIELEQTQHIDERTPAYRFDLPVFVRTADGERNLEMAVSEKTASLSATLDGPPQIVAIDPRLHVLKTADVDKSQTLWIAQANDGIVANTTAKYREVVDLLTA